MNIILFHAVVYITYRKFFVCLCVLQVIKPSLDDIQQALNKATGCVLEVSRGVAQSGQNRFQVVESSQGGHFQPSHIDVCKGKYAGSGNKQLAETSST